MTLLSSKSSSLACSPSSPVFGSVVASFHDPGVARSLSSTDHTDCVPFDIDPFMIDEDERYAISLESVTSAGDMGMGGGPSVGPEGAVDLVGGSVTGAVLAKL